MNKWSMTLRTMAVVATAAALGGCKSTDGLGDLYRVFVPPASAKSDKAEEIKPEAPKVEEVKPEAPKAEEVKPEAPKADAPKVEEIKEIKVEPAKPETPK